MRLFSGRLASCCAIGGVLLGALVLVGCGQSRPTGKLTGQVLYKGKPVSDAEVHFFMKDRGIGTKAVVDETGNFSVASLEAGTYAVHVTPPSPKEAAVGGKGKKTSGIPAKAQRQETSGLSVTVTEGRNEVKLELVD